MTEVGDEQNNWKYRKVPEHEVTTFKSLDVEVFEKTFRVSGQYNHDTQEASFEVTRVWDYTKPDHPVELAYHELTPLQSLAIKRFIRDEYK